jgi:hypothetical protein
MGVGNGVPFMGYESALGIGEETTFGTFVSSTAFIEFNTESLKQEREELKRESINGTRDFRKRLIGNETVSGSLEADLNIASDGLVYIIKQALGGTVSSATQTGSFLHTLYAGNMESNAATTTSYKKGLSIAVRRGSTNVFNYSGMRVNTLTIKGEVGSPVIMTAEFIGKTMTVGTALPTVSLSDVLPVNFVGVTIQTGASVGAVSTEYFNSFEFSLANNIEGLRVLGDRTIVQAPPARRDAKLKLSQRFDTTTAYNRFLQNTATAITIFCDSLQTCGAAAGSTTYSMKITLPVCYFNSNQPNVGAANALVHELDVSAMYDASMGSSVQFQITNATASY